MVALINRVDRSHQVMFVPYSVLTTTHSNIDSVFVYLFGGNNHVDLSGRVAKLSFSLDRQEWSRFGTSAVHHAVLILLEVDP